MGQPKPTFSISVRDLVTFVLRTGDLGGSGHFSGANRALEGTLGHQRLQKTRPSDYLPEVFVSYTHDTPELSLEIKGRIDGVHELIGSLLIEEIKTTHGPWTDPADPLHLAQARVYGWLFTRDRPYSNITIQLTYLDLETGRTTEIRENTTSAELDQFFQPVLAEYLRWLQAHCQWLQARDSSIQAIPFPFQDYRPGQRALAVAVYRTLTKGGKLFAEAPTGIGKTISALFPSIKAMGEGTVEKIFYLTAKTIGRSVAEKALADLRSSGLRLRSVTLTAKDKICFNNGQPCDMQTCPFALGYYDRIKSALSAGLQQESLTRPDIEALARQHQVCPFELSLDLSLWCDAIICDYNYAFDPSASLKRFFSQEERHQYSTLVDEAHNLPDRAREMFSADLDSNELLTLKKELKFELPACARAVGKILTRLNAFPKEDGWVAREGALLSRTAPTKIDKALQTFLDEAEAWLVRNEPAAFRQALLDLYFRVLAFRRVLETYDERYVTIFQPGSGQLKLFCIDPSALLHEALERTGPSTFFSATLTPVEHFRTALGGSEKDPTLQLDSPFPRENLKVLLHDRIPTRLAARETSYQAIADSLSAFVSGRQGNYLVYFPSYEYLRQVRERFQPLHPECLVVEQTSGMSEEDRETFLGQFQAAPEQTLVAFAVMGGIFGEGIDLVGERLIGVAVVGVGLPQLCLERGLIREYHQAQGHSGFDHAYTFPGMNRVLQAAGRVIRTDTDRGVVLLIDERFSRPQYRSLFPPWWAPQRVRSPHEISTALALFWQ